MNSTANRRMGLIALAVLILDQVTKLVVLRYLGVTQEKVVLPGFFRFVHWENTGAAWSLFHDRNGLLAVVSFLALVGLFVWRRHFYVHLAMGQVSLGLVFGGIAGNLFDRLHYHQVIDFLRFYLIRRSGEEIGFPAFNVADSAICIGVALLILVSWQYEEDGGSKPAPERGEAMQDAFRADH
jgi:signal peptidase II